MASPAAKNVAKESGIHLELIKGSGPNGRIVKADVLAQSTASRSPAKSTSTASASYIDRPLTNMRKTIAKRLTESMSTIPHFYLTAEIHMDRVLQ